MCFDFAKHESSESSCTETFSLQRQKSEIHAPGFLEFASQILFNVRCRASAVIPTVKTYRINPWGDFMQKITFTENLAHNIRLMQIGIRRRRYVYHTRGDGQNGLHCAVFFFDGMVNSFAINQSLVRPILLLRLSAAPRRTRLPTRAAGRRHAASKPIWTRYSPPFCTATRSC